MLFTFALTNAEHYESEYLNYGSLNSQTLDMIAQLGCC